MREPDLFDICSRRHGGNPMSQAANRHTAKGRDRSRIIAHLRTVPNATCDEVEQALGMNHQTCSARFSELKMEGAIYPVTKRPTRTGCNAQAWAVKP
jgi:predicted ArsR family transcriptional regulator